MEGTAVTAWRGVWWLNAAVSAACILAEMIVPLSVLCWSRKASWPHFCPSRRQAATEGNNCGNSLYTCVDYKQNTSFNSQFFQFYIINIKQKMLSAKNVFKVEKRKKNANVKIKTSTLYYHTPTPTPMVRRICLTLWSWICGLVHFFEATELWHTEWTLMQTVAQLGTHP
jgi:hypothetical protein